MKKLRPNNGVWSDHFLRAAAQASVLLVATTLLNHPVRAADDPAVAAARKRRQAIRSFDIEFKRIEIIPKGWFTEEPKGALPGPRPEKDTTLESLNHVVVEGKKFRIENNHPGVGVLEFIPSKYVCAFDGSLEKGWFHAGTWSPTGWIKSETTDGFLFDSAIAPIWLSVATPDPEVVPYKIMNWKPTGVTQLVNGRKLNEYQIQHAHGVTRFWLDPASDYVIFGIENEVEGKLRDRWEIKNRKFEQVGWLPDSWVHSRFQSGKIKLTTNVQITRMRLNEPIAADLFDVRFPENTQVHDSRNDKDYRATADGSLREVSLRDEMPPKPRVERRPSWLARNRWWSFGIAMTLIVVLMYIRFRQRPPRRPKSTSLN